MLGRWRRAFWRGVCQRRGHVWPSSSMVMAPEDWADTRLRPTVQGVMWEMRKRCQRCGTRNSVQSIQWGAPVVIAGAR